MRQSKGRKEMTSPLRERRDTYLTDFSLYSRESKGSVQEEGSTGWRDPSLDRFMVPSSSEDIMRDMQSGKWRV